MRACSCWIQADLRSFSSSLRCKSALSLAISALCCCMVHRRRSQVATARWYFAFRLLNWRVASVTIPVLPSRGPDLRSYTKVGGTNKPAAPVSGMGESTAATSGMGESGKGGQACSILLRMAETRVEVREAALPLGGRRRRLVFLGGEDTASSAWEDGVIVGVEAPRGIWLWSLSCSASGNCTMGGVGPVRPGPRFLFPDGGISHEAPGYTKTMVVPCPQRNSPDGPVYEIPAIHRKLTSTTARWDVGEVDVM